MKRDVLRQAARYSKAHKRIKRWHRVVAGFAAVVVFITTYALILPALTQERQAYCGIEAHTHEEGCYYTPIKELNCSVAPHSHSEECMNEEGVACCGYANFVIHRHNELCYNEVGLLSCRLAQITLHSHSEDCYEGEELVCDKPVYVLHSHGEGCKDEKGTLICGKEELTEHIHTDSCVTELTDAKPILVCGKQEHSHGEECYTDKTKDVETAEDWEATIPKALSGVWQEDVVAVAKSQLGYYESSVNTVTDEDGNVHGYTRYGAWYGAPYSKWDAAFVSFCLYYAGVRKEYFKYEADSAKWIELLDSSGYYKKAAEHKATVGDLVFFKKGGGSNAIYSVGIVDAVIADENGKLTGIKVIAGDVGNRVQYTEYGIEDETIVGYGTVDKAYNDYKKSTPKEHTYTDGDVTVKAVYYPAAGIPEGAELVVKPMDNTDNEYEDCYTKAKDRLDAANGEIKTSLIKEFKLYDISFYLEGKEIQPNDTVDISISFPSEESEEAEITVLHYVDDKATVPKVQESKRENGVLTTDFETDSFSLFAIVTSETFVNNIITLNKYSVTSNTNLRGLAGRAYVISSGSYALSVDENGALCTVPIRVQSTGAITADETLCRWTLTKYSTNYYNYEYYVSTTINSTTYYLMLSGTSLQLTTSTSSRSRFTFGYTGGNVTARNGNTNYIHINNNGVAFSSGSTGTAVLSLHTMPTGEFTVNFDGQIGLPQYMGNNMPHKYRLAENLSVRTTGGGYVTLPASMTLPGNYPMKLNGWYDIVNMVYYDSSMLGKQIRVTNNTIFYPEWIAETYDIGQNVDVVTNQPDTKDFITTTVFDYNELFNTHSSTYSPTDGTWTFDPNSELGFIFFDYLTVGNIGNISNKDVAVGGVTVNEEKTAGTRGASTNFPGTITPGIANEKRLDALFGEDPIAGRISLGEGDWLYSFDPEIGFYYYNSAKNAASYNQSEQRFYVYDYTVNIDSQNSLNDFLPFNYGKTTYKEKDNEANYWFGMKSEITFYLPENSGSPLNIAADGKTDMQLRFSGDDDVWIFIDGELVLDLGGVHDVVYGEVNFATGKVKTGQAKDANNIADNTADSYAGMPGVSGTAGVTTTNLPTVLEGGKEHTITIYYLERGSSLSNCSIYFNLSPSYSFELAKHDKDTGEVLEGAEFQVFDDEECTQPSILYVTDEVGNLTEVIDKTFITDENGKIVFYGLLLGKSYYIKETKPPPGYSEMDYYVIRINLSERGEVTYVALDSNGGKWIYADAYIFASGEGEHRVEIDVYNGHSEDLFIGGEKKLYVEKKWAEGSENIPESVTLRLYANGEATARTIILDNSNAWKGVFYSLKEKDEAGVEIIYTVKEENPPAGFGDSYTEIVGEEITPGDEVPAHWEQTAYLEDGYVYRFTMASYYGWAIKGISGSESIEPAVVDDNKKDQLWKAIAVNGGFLLQNVAYPDRYLGVGENVVGTTDTSGANAVMNLRNGYLVSNQNRYVQKGAKTTINGSGWGYYGVGTQAEATPITAHKWVEAYNTTVREEIFGWQVTNTPWDETMSIPIEKLWDATISEGHKEAVSINLYLVTAGADTRVTYVDSLTLNSDNGYKGSFDELPYPEEGSYYCIREVTDKYSPHYSGEVVNLFVDNTYHDVHRVTLDNYGDAVTVSITNSLLVLLPETGGNGVTVYTALGILLLIAGAGALYKNKSRGEVKHPKA